MQWSFSFVSAEAKAELDALPADVRASFERIVQLMQAVGLERVHEPYMTGSGKCGCAAAAGLPARFM